MKNIQEDLIKNIVEDYKNGLSVDEISEKYNEFSPYLVRKILKEKGVLRGCHLTEEELENIKSDFLNKLSLKELSQKYDRPEETIRKKLQKIGVYNTREQNPYTDEEISILKTYYPFGDWENIFKLLPNRDKSSITMKASKLGLVRENWKWKEEQIKEIINKKGFNLLSKFTTIKDKHKMIDNNGYLYYTPLTNLVYNNCTPLIFSTDNIYTIDNIKTYIKLNDINCDILSDIYVNNTNDLKWRCQCGKAFLCSWNSFQSGKHQCNECSRIEGYAQKALSINEVKELIKDKPFSMIDNTFTTLSKGFSAITNDGYKILVNRDNIYRNNMPEFFHKNNPYTIHNINHYLQLNGSQTRLISDEYEGNNKRLKWICGCGNEFERSWNRVLQGASLCKHCSDIKKYKLQKEQEFELVKKYFKNKHYKLLSTEYINSHSKLQYICEKHKEKGIQEITWSHCKHRDAGCKYCANEKIGALHRIPEDEIKSITESKGFIYDHVEYSVTNNNKTLIYYFCPNHRDKGVQTKVLSDMKKSTGQCNYCLGRERTHEDFVSEVYAKNPNIIILSKFTKTDDDIQCKCSIDGYIWTNSAKNLLQGQNCKLCTARQSNAKRRHTKEWFLSKMEELHKDIEVLSEFTDMKSKLKCRCKIDGHEWETTADGLINGKSGCILCSWINNGLRCRKTNEQFLEELSKINPTIIPLEEYVHEHHKIKCKCKIHNYEWYASPNKILHRKTGCPKCASYHNENNIDEILDKWGYKYTAQKRFDDCKDKNTLPFDRYLDDFNILIEYDGEGHYMPIRRGNMTQKKAEENLRIIQYHDQIKNDYCKKNKIPLIRIPYWEKDNLEEILFDNLVKYKALKIIN